MLEDASGRIWCGTGGGVSVYDPKSDSWQTFSREQGLANDYVYALLEDASGVLEASSGSCSS